MQVTQEEKTMAIVAYIIFFVPLLVGNKTEFVNYHANQGIVLFIFTVVLSTASGFLIIPLMMLSPFLGSLISFIYIVPIIFMIMGIVNASKGEMKPLPLIGGFKII